MTAHCCRTALDWTVLNSDFNRADKAMTSARLTLPDLPLCPPPNQNTLSAFFLFWLKRHFSPVGVANRLASGPLPASSALPVVQTWRNREDELVTFCIKNARTETCGALALGYTAPCKHNIQMCSVGFSSVGEQLHTVDRSAH